MTTLSLCMIVRDEAELLPRFLDATRGLRDELVVVDTGSVDGTVALLEAEGAKVIRRPWDDDFSAARNAGLAAATGDWILVLDADELVSPDLGPALRAAIEDERAGAGTLVVRNVLPHGHRHEAHLLRLFRNDPAIRFRHRIHEDVSEAVGAMLERTGRTLVRVRGHVDHLGYAKDRAAAKGKKARDQALLRRAIEEDPGDLYSRLKLLELAQFWGDAALFRQAAAEAEGAIAVNREALVAAHFGGELLALVSRNKSPAVARAWLSGFAGRVKPSAALHLRRGQLAELAGDLDGAAAEFEACRTLAGTTRDLQLAATRPVLGLARLDIARGKLAEAEVLVDEALALSPLDPEALLAAVTLRKARGGAAAVDAFAGAHAVVNGETPELAQALGDSAYFGGEYDAAVGLLGKAAGVPPRGPAAIRLGQALLAAGRLDDARTLAGEVAAELPEAGLGVLVCNLVEGKDTALDLEGDEPEISAALRPWVEAALRSRSPEVAQGFRQFAPALAGSFPWVMEGLR